MTEPDKADTTPEATRWWSRSQINALVLLAATVFALYLCYLLAAPFLQALAWAVTLAVLFTPLQRWLEARLKYPSLAAMTSILIIGLIVLVPATFVGQRLVLQASRGANLLESRYATGEWRQALDAQPALAQLTDRITRHLNLADTIRSATSWLSNAAGSILTGSVFQVIGVCLTFYLLFFFLRDRRSALQTLRGLSPLTEAEMDRLFARIGNTIFATVYGTLAVAAAQGLLGGLMFWWLGLSAPLLWGVVMSLLAVVPALGAFIVWIPAALFLVLQGSWGKALILTLWGLLAVSTVDNLLRPILVGNRLKLHTVLIFLSVVGGVILFGTAGLILGPVLLTITMELLEIWHRRTTT